MRVITVNILKMMKKALQKNGYDVNITEKQSRCSKFIWVYYDISWKIKIFRFVFRL